MSLTWFAMRDRLHAVHGFDGEQNKARRKEWIWRALGHVEEPDSLFGSYQRADAEQLQHVETLLTMLENDAKRGLA